MGLGEFQHNLNISSIFLGVAKKKKKISAVPFYKAALPSPPTDPASCHKNNLELISLS